MAYTVYMHITPSNKRYIGITGNKPETRWGNGRNYGGNVYFGAAIRKYGWENITHEIIADGLAKREAQEKERFWISYYKTQDRKNGYNMTAGGDGICNPSGEVRKRISEARKGRPTRVGVPLSEETKKKLSKSHKARYANMKNATEYLRSINPNKKPVYQFTLSGQLVKVWDSRKHAESDFRKGLKSQAIGKCCIGDCTYAYGYIWSYYEKAEPVFPQKDRVVYQCDKTGMLIKVWDNLRDAVNCFRENQKSHVIRQCVTGGRPVAYGYVWTYEAPMEVV